MRKFHFIITLLSFIGLFSCNKVYDPNRPTVQAERTAMALEGDYIVTNMVWDNNPSRVFDLNYDGKEALLFDELRSFKQHARGKANVTFCGGGPYQGYYGFCELWLPVQTVQRFPSDDGEYWFYDKQEVFCWPFDFYGSIYPDGKIEWKPSIIPLADTSTSSLDFNGASEIVYLTGKVILMNIAYKIFIPQTETFETGRVSVTLEKEAFLFGKEL